MSCRIDASALPVPAGFRVSAGRFRGLYALRWNLEAWTFDGLALSIDVQVGPWWAAVGWQVWYSLARAQRSWDQWAAETVAGEHPGITVGVEAQP